MSGKPFIFILYFIGALTLWTLSGFKGKISSHIPRPYEYKEKKTKTLIVGFIVFIFLIFLTTKIYNFYKSTRPYSIPGLTPEQTKELLEKTGGTGTIIIKSEDIDKLIGEIDSSRIDSKK